MEEHEARISDDRSVHVISEMAAGCGHVGVVAHMNDCRSIQVVDGLVAGGGHGGHVA